jgi:hypothetical protein
MGASMVTPVRMSMRQVVACHAPGGPRFRQQSVDCPIGDRIVVMAWDIKSKWQYGCATNVLRGREKTKFGKTGESQRVLRYKLKAILLLYICDSRPSPHSRAGSDADSRVSW